MGGGSSALGTRWRDHGTIVKKICYGRRWKRSSILGHPLVRLAREIDWGFSIGALRACVRQARANLACRPGW